MKTLLVFLQFGVLITGYSVFFNQWVSPSALPLFNIIPHAFPIIFVINMIMLFFWWLYKWRLGLFFTLLSIGLLWPINLIYHLYGEPETDISNLRVMSYNVHYFYDDHDGIFSLIEEEKPDVLFMQEIGPDSKGALNRLKYLEKPFIEESFSSILTMSRYPIIESQQFRVKPHHTLLSYADIALPQDTVRFINFYLESLHIDQDKVRNTKIDPEIEHTSKYLLSKTIAASKLHQVHIDSLLPQLTQTSHPIIMGGDMNAVPNTYEYYTLSNGLKDPFLSGGSKFGTTFPGFGYPLRLDFIFIPKSFKTKEYRIEDVPYSDHFPVILDLEIP